MIFTTTAITLGTLMSNVGEMFQAAIEWVAQVAETISAQPLLLFWFLLPVIGIAIGIFKRLARV